MSSKDEQIGYSRSAVEALVDGWLTDCHGCPECNFAGGPHESLRPTWIEARAVVEHFGKVDQEAYSDVIDLERALTALSRHHPKAAAVIATLALLPHMADEAGQAHRTPIARAFGDTVNFARLRNQGVAWLSAYLSGRSDVDCDRAYRGAK